MILARRVPVMTVSLRNLGLLWVLSTPATRLVAQGIPEREVAESLRAELSVRPMDTLLIDRSYQPGLLPGVAFFKARYVNPNAIDVPIETAGAAVIGEKIFVIRDAKDLSALWDEVARGRALPESFQLQAMCGGLVVGSGLVADGARFIHGPEEIPRRFRSALRPQLALHSVRSPQQREVDSGVEIVQSVWDTDLLTVTCRLARDNHLIVQIDTMARGYRNQP